MTSRARSAVLCVALLATVLVVWLLSGPGDRPNHDSFLRGDIERLSVQDASLDNPEDSHDFDWRTSDNPTRTTSAPGAKQAYSHTEQNQDDNSPYAYGGQVLDASTSTPIAGAEVIHGDPSSLSAPAVVTLTDLLGCFEHTVSSSRLRVPITVMVEGYGVRTWAPHDLATAEQGSCGPILLMDRGARLYGRVIDEYGVAIPAGRIYVLDRAAYEWLHLERLNTFSDAAFHHTRIEAVAKPWVNIGAEGRFDIPYLPADSSLYLAVISPYCQWEMKETPPLSVSSDEELTITVTRAATVEGVLIVPEGSSPGDYGLWLCTHPYVISCVTGMTKDGRRINASASDYWITAGEKGDFVLGPLMPHKRNYVRVSYSSPGAPEGFPVYVSDEIWDYTPKDANAIRLIVDLTSRTQTFQPVQYKD